MTLLNEYLSYLSEEDKEKKEAKWKKWARYAGAAALLAGAVGVGHAAKKYDINKSLQKKLDDLKKGRENIERLKRQIKQPKKEEPKKQEVYLA